jgi:hypothetical protein
MQHTPNEVLNFTVGLHKRVLNLINDTRNKKESKDGVLKFVIKIIPNWT